MRKLYAALGVLALGATTVGVTAPLTGAAPPPGTTPATAPERASDHELPNPLEDKRRELRETAMDDVLAGDARVERRAGSDVVKVGKKEAAGGGTVDQYVELSNEGTDRVFTLLVEFGNERHPQYPDQDTDPTTDGPAVFDGPLHNQIPEPDRTVDNSTVWEPNYDQAYFQKLYFGTGSGVESLKTYYEKQSSGRYSVSGAASHWVKVRYNEARYGRSGGYPCDDIVCDNTWNLVKDGMNQWVKDRKAAGLTTAQVKAELATYDVADRYDFDGDGNFNEPDGYVDHLQIVHAGGDEADGDPHQGEDAIWSHRWYAFQSDEGITGPAQNRLGGTQVGSTGIWAGDYTINPENGGLSTIAHEYGHDLGLPDHYDTAGGRNGVEWWTLMAQSRLSGKGEPIGTRAGDLSAWDKLMLGWLAYDLTLAGEDTTIDLGPHEYNSAKPQAAIVVLPEKTVSVDYGEPFAGSRFWWSGSGDDLSNTMRRTVDLTGKTTATLTMQARYDIELDYDYLYVQASDDGGASWTNLDGTVGGEPFIRDGSDNPAISGEQPGWAPVVVPLDAYAGAPMELRFLYRTDGGVAPDGFFADEVSVVADAVPLFVSGAESGAEGWTLDGFSSTTGTETGDFAHYYIASNRTFVSYDKYLATGPYNFGFNPDRPNWVEHFSYRPGLLVSYWDTSQPDNNTSEHPGQGLILPVDAHPKAEIDGRTGLPWRSRIQVHDAPFSLQGSPVLRLHTNGLASNFPAQAAQPVFDDSRSYLDPALPGAGVDVPDTGTRIRVLTANGTSMTIRIYPA
jgi:immune inhibitor A